MLQKGGVNLNSGRQPKRLFGGWPDRPDDPPDPRRRPEVRPEVVRLMHRLRRKNPKSGKRRFLREIAAELAAAGHVNTNGRPTIRHLQPHCRCPCPFGKGKTGGDSGEEPQGLFRRPLTCGHLEEEQRECEP